MRLRGSLAIWLAGSLVVAEAAAPQKYSYWVQSCSQPESGCQPNDPELAAWALEAWQNASAGAIEVIRTTDSRHARIRIFWATAEQGLYGEARPVLVDGQRGAEIYVRPAPFRTGDDRLLRETIVYLTCLHETGHALGLPHTAAFEDIMYSFQYGGDIPEYFGRYRRKLHTRDDIHKNAGISEADRKHMAEAIDTR